MFTDCTVRCGVQAVLAAVRSVGLAAVLSDMKYTSFAETYCFHLQCIRCKNYFFPFPEVKGGQIMKLTSTCECSQLRRLATV
jgi:hypothetical protein